MMKSRFVIYFYEQNHGLIFSERKKILQLFSSYIYLYIFMSLYWISGIMVANYSDEEFDTADMDFSDPEDYEDDVDDAELLGELLRQKPKESDGVDNVLIIDGIPVGK